MGEKNSSDTRVKPLGNAIVKDHTNLSKLLSLLHLVKENDIGEFKNDNVFYKDEGPRKEKSLRPTPTHLRAIIDKIVSDDNFREYVRSRDTSTSTNKEHRENLFKLNPETIC